MKLGHHAAAPANTDIDTLGLGGQQRFHTRNRLLSAGAAIGAATRRHPIDVDSSIPPPP